MKKFILTILTVSVFFIGLGSLVEKTRAGFKSDERALEIIARARQAIGGETAIKNVRSMTIVGNAAQTFTIDGAVRTEQGTLEINLQMPNQFSKMLKIGKESDGANGGKIERETHVFRITKDYNKTVLNSDGTESRRRVYVVKKGDEDVLLKDGELTNGKRVVDRELEIDTSRFRQNELFRTTFALLLSAPEGLDASYKYAGVETVDGKNCDVISVESGDTLFKLFIDQSSHLPVMMSYRGVVPMIFKLDKNELPTDVLDNVKTVIVNEDGTQTERNDKVKTFIRRLEENKIAEYKVKFSDYRNVNSVQLPYKWTQTVGGQPDQNVDVVSYEINPAKIADKFKGEKIMLRMKKAQ
ncbi:MAG: hypothetical protein M3388_10125 [Acidobacteriota bacterium]|nr:hypothetical protein [Acidobacteriota bacterium]